MARDILKDGEYFTVEYHFNIMTKQRDDVHPFVVYKHGVYESGVLAGYPARTYVQVFPSVEAALKVFPLATVVEGSTKQYGNPLPRTAPAWFDPADAGESWDEDY